MKRGSEFSQSLKRLLPKQRRKKETDPYKVQVDEEHKKWEQEKAAIVSAPPCLAPDFIVASAAKIVADLESMSKADLVKRQVCNIVLVLLSRRDTDHYSFHKVLCPNAFPPDNIWWKEAVTWSNKTSKAIADLDDNDDNINEEDASKMFDKYHEYLDDIMLVIERAWVAVHPDIHVDAPKKVNMDDILEIAL